MQVLPYYDEFGIYTTPEDVKLYINELLSNGFLEEDIIFEKCVNHFGREFSNMIKYILYED